MALLDLKKLSKGMSIKDKMKLLFEDMNRQAETAGKEFVLTPQERKAIVDDARHNEEITELRRVNDLYIAASFISIDLEITGLKLYLSISQLEKTLMGIILKGAAVEIIDKMIYDFASQDKKMPEEIGIKSNELRVKYKVDSVLFKRFDFFNHPVEKIGIASSDLENNCIEPNQNIQKSFMISFLHARKLKKKLFGISYILKKAPIDFLPNSTKKLIKEAEDLLSFFINLDTTLKPLRVYRDFGVEISKNTPLTEAKFYEVIQDITKNLELTDEERKSVESEIDKSQKDDLY